MKLLNIEEYTRENPIEFKGDNIYQDITNEHLKNYSEYLAETINQSSNYLEYVVGQLDEFVGYVEFLKRPEDISYNHWSKIKDDPTELKKYKREKTINEIIK